MVLVSAGICSFLWEPRVARATLGEPAASVAGDTAQLKATAGAHPTRPLPGIPPPYAPGAANFSVMQLTTPAGAVVSEYVGPGGTIFAVTWRGPKPPDVATLLGAYFKQYRAAAEAAAPSPLGINASSVHASDVVVETVGHMGFMWGRAYLPAALPAGVSLSEIK